MEVNDVFQINYDGIIKLHKSYFTAQQKYMSGKDAMNMMIRDSPLLMSSKQAKFCLGYCKMTIKDEVTDFEKYIKL